MRVCETSILKQDILVRQPKDIKGNFISIANFNQSVKSYSNVLDALNKNYGKNLVSFRGYTFDETLMGNYFQLPANCKPDRYQLDAARSLNDNKSVLVTAPTGTGKTAIAHYAMTKNMIDGKKTFYTTPLKALSNQKLKEFRKIYGDENVGILTGDRKSKDISKFPIIIMTTEVYRNMVLSKYFGDKNPLLDNLGTVVFDEFHYLGDPDRGPVWEESIMFTPPEAQTLALSATVGNAGEIQNWISKFQTKQVDLVNVDSKERHVPLEFNAFLTESYIKEQEKEKPSKKVNPDKEEAVNKPMIEDYQALISELKEQEKLPAILFVFSKRFSRILIDHFENHGPSLTTSKEKNEIDKIFNRYSKENYMGESINKEALLRGYAIHNAGMLPIQKQLIEELFQNKLVKAVISTETLAAGINMPARTVVISSYNKPSGDVKSSGDVKKANLENEEENRRTLTSNEFHQMAGRAGRRGIDKIGYVYTMNVDQKSEKIFDKLIKSPSNDLKSQLSPDFAFLAGCYSHSLCDEQFSEIFGKSFYVSSASPTESKQKLDFLIQDTHNKRNVLLKEDFIKKIDEDKYFTTDKGKMLSIIKGYDQLPLMESINDMLYKDFTPQMLAMVMSSIANPMKEKDEDDVAPTYGFSKAKADLPNDADNVYKMMEENINNYLVALGHNISEFDNLNKVYEFALNYKAPFVDNVYLQNKIDQLKFELAKLSEIKAPEEKKYWLSNVAKRVEREEPVSIQTLQKVQNDIAAFKREKHFAEKGYSPKTVKKEKSAVKKDNSFKKLIKNVEEQLKERDEASSKGLKVYLEKLVAMKYLDEAVDNNGTNRIAQTIKEYKQFEATHDKASIQKCLEELNIQNAGLTVIKPLLKDVRGCIKMNEEKAAALENVQGEIEGVSAAFSPLIKKTTQIKELSEINGIPTETVTYSEMLPQIVYKWMFLNSINSNSTENWKYLVTDHYETKESVDEGSIFRGIAQTIDLLSQVIEVADCALDLKSEAADIQYYKKLKQNAEKAIELLMKDPVEFN